MQNILGQKIYRFVSGAPGDKNKTQLGGRQYFFLRKTGRKNEKVKIMKKYEKWRDHEIADSFDVLLIMVIVLERQLTKKGRNFRQHAK